MSSISKLHFIAILLAGAFILQGCDWIAEKAGIDEVDVSMGSAGANLVIAPNDASSKTGNVNVGDQDIPNVFDVESITISRDNVSFSPSPGKSGGAAGSGTIDLFVIIDGAPTFATRITVANDVITNISPTTIDVGSYNKTVFLEALNRFQAGEGPNLLANHQSLTQAQIQDIIDDALTGGNFTISIMVSTNGDLSGLLQFTKATFNLDF